MPKGEKWLRARGDLRKTVPGAGDFVPDEIARAADACGKPLVWRCIVNFESRCDDDIWQDIKPSDLARSHERVTVVADACYRDGLGPIMSSWVELDGLIEAFVELYNDEMFGGDVVMVSATRLLVVHHEGWFADVST